MKKFLCAAALILCTPLALAGSAVLTWTPPTKCADNSAIENCPTLGYNIESSKDGASFTSVTTVSPSSTSYTVPNLLPGVWTFRMETVTLQNAQSAPSNTASKTIPAVTPNPPSAVTVQ